MKNAAFRLALVLAGVGFVLLLLELALRVFCGLNQAVYKDLEARLERSARQPASSVGSSLNMSGLVRTSPFDDVVYELRPGLRCTFRDAPVQINAFGLRGRECELRKPANTFRIAGLGDSVMFGWGVGEGEPYLSVLERRLNALPGPHPVYETLNFAVPGYNTAIEAAVLERKALAFQPDLVVIQFVGNDYGVPAYMERPRNCLSLKTSFLWNFVRARINWTKQTDRLVTCHLQDLEADEKCEALDKYAYMVGPAGYRRAMERLAAAVAPHRIPVIVLWGTANAEQERTLGEVTQRHGFQLVDVGPYTDAFVQREGIENTKTARRKALWLSPLDHHPSARAHPIYADALVDAMGRMGLLPAAAAAAPGAAPAAAPSAPAAQTP